MTKAAHHWSSEHVFAKRAIFIWDGEENGHLEGSSSTAGLRIDPLNADDENLYRCRIDYKIAQTKNLLIKLSIIGELGIVISFFFCIFIVSHVIPYYGESTDKNAEMNLITAIHLEIVYRNLIYNQIFSFC